MQIYPTKSILFLFLTLIFLQTGFAQNTAGALKGKVVDPNGEPVIGAGIQLVPSAQHAVTDAYGQFSLSNIPAGKYVLTITQLGFQKLHVDLNLDGKTTGTRQFVLQPDSKHLQTVDVVGSRSDQTATFLPSVLGTSIFAGKKTVVVNIQGLDADLTENLPRQVFSKVPGVMIWEMDGTGNQVGIATRGLVPHRSWELHVQQNGNTLNSDLFGYPESHYNPPMEAVGSIRIIRGSGALQYGPQFGGLLDYEIKQPDTSRALSLETQESAGSFGLFSSFNALGGKKGKWTYYGYYDFRRSDGWRENSDYHFNAWHASVKYDFNASMNLTAELSHMEYVNHFAAGLTDSLFAANPRSSNRPRNYFNPTIYVPALRYSWQIAPKTLFTARASAILGERNSVQFITLPTVDDKVNPAIGDYNPRQVDRDYYHSYAAEARLLQRYTFLKNESSFSMGLRYTSGRTLRKQKGNGTSGSNFDLSLTSPYRIDLVFNTHNYAVFAENLFQITKRLSVTPGFRYEMIQTEMTGVIQNMPNLTLPYKLNRNFPLFGTGLEYSFTPKLNAYANFTQNFRPVLHSDIVPPTDLDRIDPELKDSKGNNSELGIRGSIGEALQFDINYFRLQYDNRIGTLILNDNAGTYFYHTNIGDMLNQGAEIYIEFHPLRLTERRPGAPDIAVFTSTSYNAATYTRGTVTVAGENRDIKGNAVENVPDWISRNGITFHYRSFSTTLQYSYVSENFSDALNTRATATGVNGIVPAYGITDLSFSYYFKSRYNLRCSINNITDESYFTRRATGYPGPGILPSDGRSVVVSFGAKF